jgi:K+-transporting ATPase ATPase C chain
MRRHLVAAARMLAVVTVLLGIVYPLVITGAAHVLFPRTAEGSLVVVDGRVVGSSLLGQPFAGPGWFHPRPGTGGSPVSGPTNLGPTNPALAEAIAGRASALLAERSDATSLPADALTASASGFDPDISPADARLQAPRVARARGVALSTVLELIDRSTSASTFGFLGEPRVNVLTLNLGLNRLASEP